MKELSLSVPIQLLDEIPVFVAVLDRDAVVRFWNQGAERMTGVPRADAVGVDLCSIGQATPVALVRSAFERIVAGESWEGEIPTRGRAGASRPVHYRGAPILDAHGAPSGVIVTGVDLTQRRQSEAALRRTERDYRAAIDTALDGFVMATRDGRIIDANLAFRRMLGRDLDELRAIGLFELEAHDAAEPPGRARLWIEGERVRLETRYRHADGHLVDVEISATHADPDEDRFFLFARDISEHRRLEEELRQAQKMEAVGRLAGGVAHDFNNLLTAIGGYSELILQSLPPGDPRRGDVEEIRRAGERAATLTRQLLAFGRKQVMRPRVIDLNAVIGDVDRMLRRLIGEDVAVTTELADALPRVKADPGQIEQVLMNLAVNARDAMPSGGTLRITTSEIGPDAVHAGILPPGRHVLLEVADTGIGIDDRVRAHLFEPFFTTKEKGKGTGLGLAMVYGIVTQSGGHIEVDSTPGHGARFRLYFPAATEPSGA